jgi:hypothetical protein
VNKAEPAKVKNLTNRPILRIGCQLLDYLEKNYKNTLAYFPQSSAKKKKKKKRFTTLASEDDNLSKVIIFVAALVSNLFKTGCMDMKLYPLPLFSCLESSILQTDRDALGLFSTYNR